MNAYETPLAELLKTVPKDARFVEKEEFSSTYHPVGRLCHEAADRIAELEKDRDRLFKAHSAEMVRADKQADYIAQLEKGLESSIALNKAQAERQVKELTDEIIEQVRVAIMGAAYWCADENMPEAYNAVKVCCGQVLGILVKAQEK